MPPVIDRSPHISLILCIPHTGYETLAEIMLRRYPSTRRIPAQHKGWHSLQCSTRMNLQRLGPLEQQTIGAIVGPGVHFGIHEELHVPSHYITMLRDPAALLLEGFRWTHPDTSLTTENFRDYITHHANSQVRALLPPHYEKAGPLGREDLGLAIGNLGQFFRLVLDRERLDLSFVQLATLHGWAIEDCIWYRNEPGYIPQLDDATRLLIQETNQLDFELIDAASKKMSSLSAPPENTMARYTNLRIEHGRLRDAHPRLSGGTISWLQRRTTARVAVIGEAEPAMQLARCARMTDHEVLFMHETAPWNYSQILFNPLLGLTRTQIESPDYYLIASHESLRIVAALQECGVESRQIVVN